ncbi:MAG: hypothetical protein KGL04_10255 [Elusimicrobia bacterium]|nr:hypothetical protein [Elusimicrobiota bacterium]
MTDYKALLNNAILAYQAKVGQFLQTGQELNTISQQAQPYAGSSQADVVQRAQAISERAAALLTEFNAIESAAMTAISQANALQARMNSDPTWRAILSADWSTFGFATLSAAKKMVGQVTGLASQLNALNNRMNAEISNTQSLQNDMDNLNAYAQGNGILAPLSKMVSASGSTVSGLIGSLGTAVKLLGAAAGIGVSIWILNEAGAFKRRKAA